MRSSRAMNEFQTSRICCARLFEWASNNATTPHVAVKVDSRTQVPSR